MEIEVKAKVDDLEDVKKKLVALGAKFSNQEKQDDSYFKQKGKENEDQVPGSFIVRIREESEKAFLTTKAMTEESGVWHELETAVSDPKQLREIIVQMGYVHMFDINKIRDKGMLDGVELCLDEIKQLGKYFEAAIEAETKNGAKQKIMALFQKIGINEIQVEPRGYARIISENNGVKFKGVK